MKKRIKHYVSDIDLMLVKHNSLTENTQSEQQELDKYRRIVTLQEAAESKSTKDNK